MVSIRSLIKEVENLSPHIQVDASGGDLRVKGKTYPLRGKLKLLGFQWNSRRREWYYRLIRSFDENEE